MNWIILQLISFFTLTTNFYTLSIKSADGALVSCNSFQGRKVLIVNIATGSGRVSQLGELEQLQRRYGNRLVVIAFPSNSFQTETRADADIVRFCRSQYHTSYLIAASDRVSGPARQAVYNWLADKTLNGVMDSRVTEDFQKYVIDEKGNLLAVFAAGVSPLDQQIISTLDLSAN